MTALHIKIKYTSYEYAKKIYDKFGMEYACISLRDHIWYQFGQHRWSRVESVDALKSKFITSIDDTIIFKDKIFNECAVFFYNKTFKKELDSKNHLIGFENGVYDLKAKEFRDGRYDDYISLSTNYDYVPILETNKADVIKLENYLHEILPDRNEYVAFMEIMYGIIRDNNTSCSKIYSWNCIDSYLISLIKQSLGSYCDIIPENLLQPYPKHNIYSPKLSQSLHGKKLAFCEYNKDKKINNHVIESFTGNGPVLVHPLYFDRSCDTFQIIILSNQLLYHKNIKALHFNTNEITVPQDLDKLASIFMSMIINFNI